jgi:hypothetical protein
MNAHALSLLVTSNGDDSGEELCFVVLGLEIRYMSSA